MPVEIVNVCKGIGCDIAPHCQHYRYVEPAPGRFIKEWTPTQPGEGCPDLKLRKMRRWGDGRLEEGG